MRHRKGGRKLNMDSTERSAMFRNMVTSLVIHGSIRTTEARAKELRRFAERVVTIAKRAPATTDGLSGAELQAAQAKRVHAFRRARRWVMDKDALGKLFTEYAVRFATRPGGYTRITKAGFRPGDDAAMAVIEWVDNAPIGSETASA